MGARRDPHLCALAQIGWRSHDRSCNTFIEVDSMILIARGRQQ
ncbi:hypothetical protein BLAT2472_60361 [Burkholderia latens]